VSDVQKVQELAQRLVREGYVDNEPDARLLAIRIFVAAKRVLPTDRERDDDG
jgi:hypothetical protein